MSKYVIATVAHFESRAVDVTTNRKSLDGVNAIVEVLDGDTSYDSDPDANVFTHDAVIAFIDSPEAAGLWY